MVLEDLLENPPTMLRKRRRGGNTKYKIKVLHNGVLIPVHQGIRVTMETEMMDLEVEESKPPPLLMKLS